MKILLTIDVEPYLHDSANPYSHLDITFRNFLEFVKKRRVPCVLFITGDVAENCNEMLTPYLDYVEIGVHTHPGLQGYPTDKLRQYSLQEQLNMIKKDKESISKFLGIEVRSFRAGKLAANDITLSALRSLNLVIDSSILVPYVFRLRSLSNKPWRPFVQNGLIRIPVLLHDERCVSLSYKLMRRWIDLLEMGKGAGCLLLHSWFPDILRFVSSVDNQSFVNMDYFLDLYRPYE